ncbi:MAG: nucleotidyltransferase domain-containing protein [Methanosarcinales archaeon]
MKVLRIASKFAEKVKELNGILVVCLFGSVVRGTTTRNSDIDIAVVYDKYDPMLEGYVEQIASKVSDKIQVVHTTLKELADNPTLAGALSGEGIVLYGKTIVFNANGFLKPNQNTRSKLNRALYGGVSTASYKNKKYLTKYHGIAEGLGIKKLAPSVLLCDRERANAVTKTLEQFKAEYHELAVWVY